MKQVLAKLGEFRESDLAWIEATATLQELRTGEPLFFEGNLINALYILLEGSLTAFVSVNEAETSEQEIGQISPGEIIGAPSFVDQLPPSSTVKATADSVVLSLPWQQLELKMRQDKHFAALFYAAIAQHLSRSLRGISDLLVRNKIVPGLSLRKVLFVFGVINDSDIEWMIATGQRQQIAPNTVMIQQGNPVDALYILLRGTLSVAIEIENEGEKVSKEVAKLLSGEIVGEMSLIETGKASATVKAFDSSTVLAIPQSQLIAKLEEDLGFASRFYRAIAVILVDRLRDRLVQRGFSQIAYVQGQSLDEEIEYEDEIDLDTLDQTAIAATRFNWLVQRIS